MVLWPAGTAFTVKVDRGVPVTVDGEKAGFAQFAVGQIVILQYVIFVKRRMGGPTYTRVTDRFDLIRPKKV